MGLSAEVKLVAQNKPRHCRCRGLRRSRGDVASADLLPVVVVVSALAATFLRAAGGRRLAPCRRRIARQKSCSDSSSPAAL